MEVTVTITADDTELPEIVDMLAGFEHEAEMEMSEGVNGDSTELDLREDERYVVAALHEAPRSALRVVHRAATELNGSPFDDYQEEDGWTDERQHIRDILWSLKSDGLVDNDGQLWFPTDAAPQINVT